MATEVISIRRSLVNEVTNAGSLMNTSVNDVWVASCHIMIDLGCPSLVIPF